MLDIRAGEDLSQWMVIPVDGKTPGKRYGHTMIYFKPYLLLFGGNDGINTLNDSWVLNSDVSPFVWIP